ncbi:MAG TPA: LuxR C-terminal-related transcriptional regulator [Anaerolineales bacterium]|nr:LuxR C-terminal-related transcriptional regulator [Anaerolineales bacterium]
MTDLQSLSDRETEILELLATGRSNKEIARVLHISTNTVKVHVRNIFGKLDVNSRTEASMVALRAGLIAPTDGEPAGSPTVEAGPDPIAVIEDPVLTGSADGAGQTGTGEPAAAATGALPAQTWILAGVLVAVTLLVVIAYRLFNPAPAAEATPPADAFAIESQWRDRPNLPAARTRAAGVAFENAVYVIGGLVGGVPSPEVARLDPETGAWTALAPKPTPVAEVQAAVLGGLVYVPGGRLASDGMSAALEIYDPRLDAWSSGPDLPAPVGAYALTAFEGKLYLFGGHDGTRFSDRVFSFDPDGVGWTELTPMPAALSFAGAAAIGNSVYVIGGFDGENPASSTWIYSPALEGGAATNFPWRPAAPMPEGRYGMGLVNIADKIYLIGGAGGEGRHFTQMDYTPQTDLWQVVSNPLAGEWAHAATIALGTDIFVLGGELDDVPTDRSLSYQVLFIVVIPLIR